MFKKSTIQSVEKIIVNKINGWSQTARDMFGLSRLFDKLRAELLAPLCV